MSGFLRGILGGTILFATMAGPVWAANPGARTEGSYANGNTPSAGVADAVTNNIRGALEADRRLRGSTITVATAENGVVTLVGSVPNLTAKQQAIEIAKETPGVVTVNDQLRLLVSSPNAPVHP